MGGGGKGGGGQTVVQSGGGPTPEAAKIAGEYQLKGIELGTESAEKQLALAIEELKRQEGVARGDIAPYRETGEQALYKLADLAGVNGPDAQRLAQQGVLDDPGTQFQIEQGQKALERSAAATGTLQSVRTGKALTEFGQNISVNAIGNRQAQLAQLAGFGGSAAGQTAANALGVGQNIAGVQSNLGSTLANSAIASGNARASSHLMANQQPATSTTYGGGGSGLGGLGTFLGGVGSLFGTKGIFK